MITPETLEPGKGYECIYSKKNIPDTFGRPGGMMSLADIQLRRLEIIQALALLSP